MDTQKISVDDGSSEIFEPVLESFRERKLYKINPNIVTPNIVSEILLQLCFIFDFNFKESYRILMDKKIVEKKINLLRENCDKNIVNEIEQIAKDYINSKL